MPKLITSCYQIYEVLNYISIVSRSCFKVHSSLRVVVYGMASKDTPKKLYKKRNVTTVTVATARCRLCNCVSDPGHSKNLFRAQNKTILRNGEIVYGSELPQDENLPHSPCERRLKNATHFKNVIRETQRALREDIRTKRCVELSPSVVKLSAKQRASATRRRRSIDFSTAADKPQTPVSKLTFLNSHLSLHK